MNTFSLLSEAEDFNSLEQMIWSLAKALVARFLVAYLEHRDRKLMRERPKTLRLKGRRSRTITCLVGEITIERRVYLDLETGRYRYLLDEALKLPARQRFSENVRVRAVYEASRHSYRESSRLVGGQATASSIHTWTQQLGRAVVSQFEAARRKVFDLGRGLSGPVRKVKALFCEADGVYIRLQRERNKTAEVKLAIVHEGWERLHPSSREYRLRGKLVYASLKGTRQFWETLVTLVGQRWDLESLKVLAGDGAEWIKKGLEYFPAAVYQLCRFHLARRIRECLAWSKRILARVMAARGEPERLLYEAGRAVMKAPGPEEEAQAKLLVQYLAANADGLGDYRSKVAIEGLELRGLGAIESNVDKLISNRMCKRGMSWSLRGAASMLAAITLRANGLFGSVAPAVLGPVEEPTPVRRPPRARIAGADPGLRRGHLPILHSGCRPVTRALRALIERRGPF